MGNPVHLGVIVLEDCMKPLNLSIAERAKLLGVARQTLSNGTSINMKDTPAVSGFIDNKRHLYIE